MLANFGALTHTRPHGGWVNRLFLSFPKAFMLHIQINGYEAKNTVQANILPFYTLSTPGGGLKVKTFFAYQIKRNEV